MTAGAALAGIAAVWIITGGLERRSSGAHWTARTRWWTEALQRRLGASELVVGLLGRDPRFALTSPKGTPFDPRQPAVSGWHAQAAMRSSSPTARSAPGGYPPARGRRTRPLPRAASSIRRARENGERSLARPATGGSISRRRPRSCKAGLTSPERSSPWTPSTTPSHRSWEEPRERTSSSTRRAQRSLPAPRSSPGRVEVDRIAWTAGRRARRDRRRGVRGALLPP